MPKFLKRTWSRYSKLGKGRKKIQAWKRPTGRHNKMRNKMRGYSPVVSIGYKGVTKSRGKIQEKKPRLIYNLSDLEKIRKDEIAVIGKIGKKKKIEIAKKAKEMKIKIYNLNIKKFLKKNESKEKKK